jgi:hypothetical protein
MQIYYLIDYFIHLKLMENTYANEEMVHSCYFFFISRIT